MVKLIFVRCRRPEPEVFMALIISFYFPKASIIDDHQLKQTSSTPSILPPIYRPLTPWTCMFTLATFKPVNLSKVYFTFSWTLLATSVILVP